MSIKNQTFNRGETERVELVNYGTMVARPVGIAVGIVLTGTVTITKRKDGLFTLYSPKCRGGNGRGWTGARGSDLLTIVGQDMTIGEAFSDAMGMTA